MPRRTITPYRKTGIVNVIPWLLHATDVLKKPADFAPVPQNTASIK